MSRTTDKKLKKQAEIWRADAVMAPAAYRVYTYLKIEDMPEEIVNILSEEALEIWNEQISFEDINADIEIFIKTMLQSLNNRKPMEAFLFIPTILADLYVKGEGVSKLEGNYRTVINKYADMATFDRPLAEIDAMYNLAELVNEIVKKAKLKLEFDVVEVVTEFIDQQGLLDREATGTTVPQDNLGDVIDKALRDYEEQTGESALAGVEEGVDTEVILEEIEKLKEEKEKDKNAN